MLRNERKDYEVSLYSRAYQVKGHLDSSTLPRGHAQKKEPVKVSIMSYPAKPTGKGNVTYMYGLLDS